MSGFLLVSTKYITWFIPPTLYFTVRTANTHKGAHTEAFHLKLCGATYLFNLDFDAVKTKNDLHKQHNQTRYLVGIKCVT